MDRLSGCSLLSCPPTITLWCDYTIKLVKQKPSLPIVGMFIYEYDGLQRVDKAMFNFLMWSVTKHLTLFGRSQGAKASFLSTPIVIPRNPTSTPPLQKIEERPLLHGFNQKLFCPDTEHYGICFQRQEIQWLNINDLSSSQSRTRKMSTVFNCSGSLDVT